MHQNLLKSTHNSKVLKSVDLMELKSKELYQM